jgi:putative addiction module component (TIGR02574 family)
MLEAKDRERLVDLLLGDLDERKDVATETAWRVEIHRRVAAYESGQAVLHDADAAIANLRRLLTK